jgi:hypothetical protein
MFASSSLTSWTSSSRNTISQAEIETAGSTLKFAKAVTDLPKLASLPITFSDCASLLRASTKLLPRRDFGAINGIHSNFASSWMTLVLNTSTLNMTNLPALPSNGIILANAAA